MIKLDFLASPLISIYLSIEIGFLDSYDEWLSRKKSLQHLLGCWVFNVFVVLNLSIPNAPSRPNHNVDKAGGYKEVLNGTLTQPSFTDLGHLGRIKKANNQKNHVFHYLSPFTDSDGCVR